MASSRRAALFSAAGLLLGCAGAERHDAPESLEIFSWWTSPSEVAALDALLDVHQARHPDVKVINAAEALADKARARLADRMRRGLPPDTFQANIGRDLFEWVLFDGRNDAESKVQALNTLADEQDWFHLFPDTVLEALSFEGRIYGVPLNVHRLNTLFYNKRLFDELELAPPNTLAQLHQVIERLVEAGYAHPLSIGNRFEWTMSLVLMENIFPAVAGPDFYLEYWRGEHPAEHELVQEAIAELLRLWPHFNPDAHELDWTQGVERLFAADPARAAALSVMGDWAKGHLQALGYEAGKDFDSVPFPGTEGTFVFTVDCFSLPKGAPHEAAVRELLVSFGSRNGQLAFNQHKGSLPARLDIDEEALDTSGRRAWRDFQGDRRISALSGLLDPDFAAALASAVRESLIDEDPDPILFALRNNL